MTRPTTLRPAVAGLAGLLAVLALGAGAGAATLGWLRHGEAIFLTLAGEAWATCF